MAALPADQLRATAAQVRERTAAKPACPPAACATIWALMNHLRRPSLQLQQELASLGGKVAAMAQAAADGSAQVCFLESPAVYRAQLLAASPIC